MLDNEAVKKELIDFIGDDNLKMLKRFYEKHHNIFPVIVEDHIPISINSIYGRAIRNHINEVFNVVPDKIKDWGTFEDYIYNMLVKIVKESGSK